MKKRKHLTSLTVAGLVALALLAGACATPTPQVIEKEVVVEKEVPVTVEIEKEVMVEKKVIETVEVEKVVTQVIKETIKETVVVEGTPQVVEKEVTRVIEVEKEVEVPVTVAPEPKEPVTLVVGMEINEATSMDPAATARPTAETWPSTT